MAKKPHLDFKLREELDGNEEIYTQHQDFQPHEQKFTLSQVKAWILQDLKQHTEFFTAEIDQQTHFSLEHEVILPMLSEVHFEKCKLTFGQDYNFRKNEFIYLGKDFEINEGEQLEVRYFHK